jgi:hypothetical protein
MSNELIKHSPADLTEVEDTSAMEVALQQMNQMTTVIVTQIATDREKNEELFCFMKDQIEISDDKNPATREAMVKVKAKLINPNKGMNINISLGGNSDSKGHNTSSMIDMVDNLSLNYTTHDDDEDED